MRADAPLAPDGLEVLQAGGGHGLGNALYLDRAESAVLKIYRPRRSRAHAWREGLRSIAHQVFEGKRGTGPRTRQRTESLVLRLWAAHGFEVPAVLERSIPVGITDPALWIEYCPGETLDRVLAGQELDLKGARALVSRLAEAQARRHRRAADLAEPLLTMEHATIVHLLVSGERLVTIDFEIAYRRKIPATDALSRELAGTLRSFFRRVPERGRELFEVYVDGYPERDLLRAAAESITRGGGLARQARRWQDGRRPNRPSKVEVMESVLERL